MYYLSQNREYEGWSSRYQVLRLVVDNDETTHLETYNQLRVPESNSDSYHIVEHSEVNRLDIIAQKYYGFPNYWWAIALANNMIDPFVVNEGVMLRIPSILTLNDSSNKILSR